MSPDEGAQFLEDCANPYLEVQSCSPALSGADRCVTSGEGLRWREGLSLIMQVEVTNTSGCHTSVRMPAIGIHPSMWLHIGVG